MYLKLTNGLAHRRPVDKKARQISETERVGGDVFVVFSGETDGDGSGIGT